MYYNLFICFEPIKRWGLGVSDVFDGEKLTILLLQKVPSNMIKGTSQKNSRKLSYFEEKKLWNCQDF